MSGPPDFRTIAANLRASIDIARTLINTDQVFEKAELRLKLSDLMVQLAEARSDLAYMQDSMDELGREFSAVKEKLKFAGTMNFETPYYWNTADGKREGPYCPTCWEGREKLVIHLFLEARGQWVCNTCGKRLFDRDFRPERGFEPLKPT